MKLSTLVKRCLTVVTIIIMLALLCVTSYQNFVLDRIVPVNKFESILSDSCKIIDMKWTYRRNKAFSSSDDVPLLIKTLLNFKKDASGNIRNQHRRDLRYYFLIYTIKGENETLTCNVSVADGYAYRIEIIVGNNEKEENIGVALAEIIKLWKPMKKLSPTIIRKQSIEK